MYVCYKNIEDIVKMVSEPIIVLYKSKTCPHCENLSRIWDGPNDSITSVLKKIKPNIRFYTVTSANNSGVFDENIVPKDMRRFAVWFPMIILVPGPLWDEAMTKLGPKNDVKLVEGVQIFNGKWVTNEITKEEDKIAQDFKYNMRNTAEYGRWLTAALANPSFIKAQNNTSVKPIQPMLKGPVKVIPGGSKDYKKELGEVCSINFVSRTKY